MTALSNKKLEQIVSDGHLSLLSDGALGEAASQVAREIEAHAGIGPDGSQSAESLSQIAAALDKEVAARSELSKQ